MKNYSRTPSSNKKSTSTKMYPSINRNKETPNRLELFWGRILTLSRRSLTSTLMLKWSRKTTLKKRQTWLKLICWDFVRKRICKGPNTQCYKSWKKSTTRTLRASMLMCFHAFWKTCASSCTSSKKYQHTFQWAISWGRKFWRKWQSDKTWNLTTNKTNKLKYGRKKYDTTLRYNCQMYLLFKW